MSKEVFIPEKVRELAVKLSYEDVFDYAKLITKWLEQKQPEPVVVGLSDEQLEDLVKGLSIATTDYQFKNRLDFAREWLAAQTFVKPDVGISDTRPNWGDAPSWANWLAQDETGDWFYFEKKPTAGEDGWMHNNGTHESTYAFVKNWQQTLQERPKSTPQVEFEVDYIYKGAKYSVQSIGKMKVGSEWVDSVTYANDDYSATYTRILSDFLAKFERVG